MSVSITNNFNVSPQPLKAPSKTLCVIKSIALVAWAILSLAITGLGIAGLVMGVTGALALTWVPFSLVLVVGGLALFALSIVVASQELLAYDDVMSSIHKDGKEEFKKRLLSTSYPSEPSSGPYCYTTTRETDDVPLLGENEDLRYRSYLIDGDDAPCCFSSRYTVAYVRPGGSQPVALLPRKYCKYGFSEKGELCVIRYNQEEVTRQLYYCEAGGADRGYNLTGFSHDVNSVCLVNETTNQQAVCLEDILERGEAGSCGFRSRCGGSDSVAILRECDERNRPCQESISRVSCGSSEYVVITVEDDNSSCH